MTSYLDLRVEARRHRPEVPHLPHLHTSAIATWRQRMINEHQSSHVFSALAEQARALALPAEQVTALREFEAEERRHGVLCGAVVEALGGEARAQVAALQPVPVHASVAPLEGFLRNVLSVSCLSETVAVALIGAERLEMPAGPLRELLTTIWADEVGHARFGWRLLGELAVTLSVAQRSRLSLYLR
ncbi:MAG TPA: ferritin-like domain-containing protein, partial [Polyangiaceae bacterium]|nr:ferritin-like domain-containing protein [Polyangiaceae bacterium]